MIPLAAILLAAPPQAPAPPPVPPPPQAPPVRPNYDPYDLRTYAALVAHVERGNPATLFVGVPDTAVAIYGSHLRVPSGFAQSGHRFADGVYDCSRGPRGTAVMVRREPPAAATPAKALVVGLTGGVFQYVLVPPGVPASGSVVEFGSVPPVVYPLGTQAATQTGRTPAERAVRAAAATPGVVARPPFAPPPASYTPATTAPPAVGVSTRSPGSTPTVLTPTFAPPVGRRGGTSTLDCPGGT